MPATQDRAADTVRGGALPLSGTESDYDELLDRIGGARFVLLGEASHGAREFYRERARITQRMIREKGFAAVAVEADWPDAYRINRYVRGAGDAAGARDALQGFVRFPAWMWRNTEVLDFVSWLRAHNDAAHPDGFKAGFYGLDLYSMYTSMRAVVEYLDKVDPDAARRARFRYACFEQFHENSQAYGYEATFGMTQSCEQEVVHQLVELQRRAADLARRDGRFPEDEFFFVEQNAQLVRNAERYYRAMFEGRVSSWNLRDRHMADTLDRLADHLGRRIDRPKIVVWAHNSHVGDARATGMGAGGEWNVGQLARERHRGDTFSVGFTTHHGTVTAASDWDEPADRKHVRPALPESYEAVFHDTGLPRFLLLMRRGRPHTEALRQERLERAIGVVYRPETERASHYFQARLPEQFDAVIHIDETKALEPLDHTAEWSGAGSPDTYPSGI